MYFSRPDALYILVPGRGYDARTASVWAPGSAESQCCDRPPGACVSRLRSEMKREFQMPSFQEIRRRLVTIAAVLAMAVAGAAAAAPVHADEVSNNGGNNNDGDGIVNVDTDDTDDDDGDDVDDGGSGNGGNNNDGDGIVNS